MARRKKPIWKSKIFWLAMIPIAIEVTQSFMQSEFINDSMRSGVAIGISTLTILARYLSNGEAVTVGKSS